MNGYCNNCGSVLPPAARFCPACGTVIAGYAQAGYTQTGYQSPYGIPYAAYPRLVRPIFGRQFAGVCIGLAQTYGWDVGLVRILAVVTGIFLCPVPEILYLAGWIGIPEETVVPQAPPPQQTT
jgi:phage shock protein PspC (stress-responsive transcriptional regulator)